MTPNAAYPRARSNDLATQALIDETLVYDKLSHQAHCLNPLAALVWKHCDGRTSRSELAGIVQQQLGLPADPEVIDLTLQELAQINLLQQAATVTMPADKRLSTRREIARKLGVGAAAALLLAPLVSSIMTQSAMAQASPAPKATTTTTTLT